MVAAGVPPDQFTFAFILESAGAGGRLKVALEVFEEMRAAGVAPKTNTYNFLIEACASAPTPDVSESSIYRKEKIDKYCSRINLMGWFETVYISS